MAFHFLMQYSTTRALQPMLNSPLKGAGTFAVFAAMSLVVALPVYLFLLPETSGQSLERIDELFDLPWYKIGRASRRPVRDEMPSHSMPAALESQWQRDGISAPIDDKEKDKPRTMLGSACLQCSRCQVRCFQNETRTAVPSLEVASVPSCLCTSSHDQCCIF